MCVLFVGNPRRRRTAAEVPRGAGAHPVRVRAAALQACVHAGLQPAGAHAALAVAHLPHRVPQHPRRVPQRPPCSGKRAHPRTHTNKHVHPGLLILPRERNREGLLFNPTNTFIKYSPLARSKGLFANLHKCKLAVIKAFCSTSSQTMRVFFFQENTKAQPRKLFFYCGLIK